MHLSSLTHMMISMRGQKTLGLCMTGSPFMSFKLILSGYVPTHLHLLVLVPCCAVDTDIYTITHCSWSQNKKPKRRLKAPQSFSLRQ